VLWSLICCWVNRRVNNWALWSERPFIKGIISNLFEYELSIKKLSIIEQEWKLIIVGKLTILLRL